jgi:hypothetical protein
MEKPKLIQGGAQQGQQSKSDTKKSDAPTPTQLVTQREAVFLEVMQIIKEEKVTIPAKQSVKSVLNEIHLKKISTNLAKGFQSKKVALKETESNKKKLNDPKLMEIYCLGLINNWLRRDSRLNGKNEK